MGRRSYQPDDAIGPGATILETIEAINLSQKDLALRMGRDKAAINDLIKNKVSITEETAVRLENVLGIPASFWMNLDRNYRENLARIEEQKRLKEERAVLEQFSYNPYRDLVKLGWVESFKDPMDQVKALLRFFGVHSFRSLQDVVSVAFRKNEKKECEPLAIAAWLRKGELCSREIRTAPYDKARLTNALPALRKLSREEPAVYSKKIQELCAACGVAVVYLPHLPKTYVNGATKWLTSERALILLTLRGRKDDIFWFSLFHEIGHVLKHSKKETFVSFEKCVEKDDYEKEADHFAAETLIPSVLLRSFAEKGVFTAEAIKTFAERADVAPSIVVGRLMHEKKISFNSPLNSLRTTLEWREE